MSEPINLFDRAVALSLSINRFGIRRKVNTRSIQTDADRDLLHVSKDIIDSDEFRAISRFDSETRHHVWRIALPSIFRAGVFMIPFEDVTPLDDYLTQRESERAALVSAAIAKLPDIKQAAEERLKSLFDEADYPPDNVITGAYSMAWQIVELGTPGKLKAINVKIYERMLAQEKERAVNEVDQIKLMLRAGMAEVVEHMIDRLTPDVEGKKKVFRDSLVEKAMEFLADCEHKTAIVDDAELAALVKHANEVMSGVTAKDLRSDQGFADYTREQFTNIKTVLESMMKDAPSRKFHLRRESEDAEDSGEPEVDQESASA